MTKYYLKRWLAFFLMGLPLQVLTYLLYIPASLWFWFFVRGKYGVKLVPPPPKATLEELVEKGKQDPIRDEYFLDHTDVHGPLVHMYLWMLKPQLAQAGLKALVYLEGNPISEGCVKRKAPNDDWVPVSGDTLSAWTNAATRFGTDPEVLRKVARHYLKNCMGLGCWRYGWEVSARSSNSGVNFVFDGWKGLNQPAAAPQYFTSASLLLLASKRLGGWWKLVYWAHWLLMGGWLYTLVPFIYVPGNSIYYGQQITLLNLWSMYKLTHNPIYLWSIRYIVIHCAPQGNVNPMFYCWGADVGALTKAEVAAGAEVLRAIKHVWPQHDPKEPEFYDLDSDTPLYSVVGGAASMFLKRS